VIRLPPPLAIVPPTGKPGGKSIGFPPTAARILASVRFGQEIGAAARGLEDAERLAITTASTQTATRPCRGNLIA
jgi:hypothetical protein